MNLQTKDAKRLVNHIYKQFFLLTQKTRINAVEFKLMYKMFSSNTSELLAPCFFIVFSWTLPKNKSFIV
jgi:hypothetical protein